ncbi:MAG TPA: Holliday junction branch migration protein RuvA [Actinomycetaceae bacterium]|nr:Holliday junction branch migration protein RuvA [Actinomycetaceae bacterium]
MISSLRGTVANIALDHAVVDVGGVGFTVLSTPGTLASLRVGSEGTLSTTLVVREDALTLYGFGDDDERDTFLILQTVTGVGPRLALGILAVLGPEDVRRAVANEDLVTLQRVPGIGKKSAQRLVLELAGKIGAPSAEETAQVIVEADGDVVAALTQLGWTASDASAAVSAVSAENTGKSAILRAALRYLGGNRG